jgi:hypothetical protein
VTATFAGGKLQSWELFRPAEMPEKMPAVELKMEAS